MKFYDALGPNPKLVRMFAAEKGFSFPEVVKVDMMTGANRQEPYLSKNPAGQVPALELDDGLVISETVAICEYLEELKANPPLIGADPAQRAQTRMWVRRVEWKVTQPLADVVLFAILDFGASVGQTLDPANRNLAKWLASTQARASAKA